MTTIYIDSTLDQSDKTAQIEHLIRSAIDNETKRLELALDLARQRLVQFETKYDISSEIFMTDWAAEDLDGGDDEYVRWAGEYGLMQRLKEQIRQLQEIDYGDSNLFRSDQSAT